MDFLMDVLNLIEFGEAIINTINRSSYDETD